MATAKDIQTDFIKTYLKPTLKEHGYKISGQTWWKNKGDFFVVINLQNSRWNSKEELSFCLNIGIALTDQLADREKKKVKFSDFTATVRENAYLTEDRKQIRITKGGWLGYKITNTTNVNEFIEYFRIDLEDHILKILDSFKTLDDCIKFYENLGFSADQFKSK
jgi:hypothetical protein